MISVLVLTKNEERDLPDCLASLKWCDDIHLYDSYSEDSTVAIAEAAGATITQRAFDSWSSHQNWGLKNIHFKHDWVFYIDADERMTEELCSSIHHAVQSDPLEVAFRIQRRDFLQGTWLRHVQASAFYMRLFRPTKIRYERLVNPISIADGDVGEVKGYLDHFPFSKGLSHWVQRHNSYSSLEAQQIVNNRRSQNVRPSIKMALIASDFHERRFHQKELFYRLPLRPLAKFLILYFIKRGFLDGRAGLTYAVLQSIYEYLIVKKVEELEHASRVTIK